MRIIQCIKVSHTSKQTARRKNRLYAWNYWKLKLDISFVRIFIDTNGWREKHQDDCTIDVAAGAQW